MKLYSFQRREFLAGDWQSIGKGAMGIGIIAGALGLTLSGPVVRLIEPFKIQEIPPNVLARADRVIR